MISLTETDGRSLIALPGTLDIGAAPALKEAFQQAVAAGRPLLVDAAEVERVSTACLQVLIAGASAVTEAGLEFALGRPAEPMVSAFDDLGLFPVMMKWKIEA